MALKNRFSTPTTRTNLDGVTQYSCLCEKYDEDTNEVVWSTQYHYLEANKDNVEADFDAMYTKTIAGTPFTIQTLRDQRNNKIKESDWMSNSDVTMTDAWKTYRQALRDLTNGLDTADKVNSVTWPTEPS